MTEEQDFTMFVTMGLPGPWPPSTKIQLFEKLQQDGQLITLNAYPDGHLEATVRVLRDAPPSANMHFQRVGVTGQNQFVLALVYGNGRLQAWVNSTKLSTLAASSGAVFDIPDRKPLESQPSYVHHEASTLCQSAVRERADRFRTRKKFSSTVANRGKTSSQQREELGQAVQALRHFHSNASRGALYLVPALASQLRGLVYWPPRSKDRPTWNPLLLRLANTVGAPLPVFAISKGPFGEPDIFKTANYYAKNSVPSCRRQSSEDDLMDIEDYLSLPILLVKATGDDDRTATVSEILAAAANSMGSAHYDETVPLFLDDFQSQVFLGRTLTQVLILSLAEVVAELGEHLLTGSSD